MARKRIVSESRKKLIQDFLLEFQPKDARDIQAWSQIAGQLDIYFGERILSSDFE